jgi:hypothetical protein
MADKTIAIEIKVEGLDNVKLSTTELDKLAAVRARNRKESQDTAKAITAEAGSMAQLRAETSLLIQKANQLNTTTKEGAKEFNALQKQIVQNKEKIRDFDRQLSGSTTLVGEYEKGFSGAFKKISGAVIALGGVIAGLKTGWEAYKSVMASTAATADEFDFEMAQLGGTLDGVLRTVAAGDWGNFFKNMKEGGRSAKELAEATDIYHDAMQATSILTAEESDKLYALEAIWRNTSKSYKDRTASLDEWVKIKEDAAKRELTIENNLNQKLVEEFTLRTGLNEEQLKLFATAKAQYADVIAIDENIKKTRLNRDIDAEARKKSIKELEVQANELLKSTGMTIQQFRVLLSNERKLGTEEIKTLTESYAKVAKLQASNNQIQAETAKIKGSLEKKSTKEEKDALNESLLNWRVYIDEKGKIISEQVRDVGFFGDNEQLKGKGAGQIGSKKTSPDPEGDNLRKYVLRKTKEFAKEKKKIEIESEEETANRKREIATAYLSAAGGLLNSYTSLLESNKQKELSAAGDNAKKREEIERSYRKKQQNAAYLQAVINAAQGITAIWARWAANPVVAGILTAIEAAATGLQLKIIAGQKFAQGGLLQGRSHAQGGIPIRVNGQSGYEAEGGEAIINKRSTAKYRALLSRINEDGGGKKFALGGVTPEQTNAIGFDLNAMSRMIAANINSIQVINKVGEFDEAYSTYTRINTRQRA